MANSEEFASLVELYQRKLYIKFQELSAVIRRHHIIIVVIVIGKVERIKDRHTGINNSSNNSNKAMLCLKLNANFVDITGCQENQTRSAALAVRKGSTTLEVRFDLTSSRRSRQSPPFQPLLHTAKSASLSFLLAAFVCEQRL